MATILPFAQQLLATMNSWFGQQLGHVSPWVFDQKKTNAHRNNAILVLSATSDKYSPSVVEQCKGRDIFNKKTGRVPRQLADILAPQLESGKLIKGLAFYTDKITNKVEVHTYAASIC